jgi:hypothetical protein
MTQQIISGLNVQIVASEWPRGRYQMIQRLVGLYVIVLFVAAKDTGRSSYKKIVKPLTDTDPMPFGKHKGTPMQDVPATYLHWLWTKTGGKDDKVSPVADYTRRNLDALKKEYTDGIW